MGSGPGPTFDDAAAPGALLFHGRLTSTSEARCLRRGCCCDEPRLPDGAEAPLQRASAPESEDCIHWCSALRFSSWNLCGDLNYVALLKYLLFFTDV